MALGTAPSPAAESIQERWHRTVPGGWFRWSSPVITDLDGDGSNDVVVGGQDGKVYAWDADGDLLPGWPGTALGAVASSPAVADLDGDDTPEVVVGAGSLDVPNQQGGVTVLNRDGRARCSYKTTPRPDLRSTAVFNAPAVGDVDGDGRNDIVAGSFNQDILLLGADCKAKAVFSNTDSVWSAPALYDVDGDEAAEIFIGGDASKGALPHSGGYFRSLTFRDSKLVQRWVRLSDETFQSAGAIGDIDNDGRLEVVTGSGSDYCRHHNRCSLDSRRVWAFHLDDGSDVAGWPKEGGANAHFMASPALGDLDGDGLTDVAVGSSQYVDQNGDGAVEPSYGVYTVYFGNGRSSGIMDAFTREVVAAPILADVDGNGLPEMIVTMEGRLRLWQVHPGFYAIGGDRLVVSERIGERGLPALMPQASAAAVGELGPGRYAIVVASFDDVDGNRGYLHVLDIPTPTSMPWPQHRKNAARTGAGPWPNQLSPRTLTTRTTAPPATATTARPLMPPPTTPTTAAPTTSTTLPEPTTTTAPPTTTSTTGPDEQLTVRMADPASGPPGWLIGTPAAGAVLALGAVSWRRRRRRPVEL